MCRECATLRFEFEAGYIRFFGEPKGRFSPVAQTRPADLAAIPAPDGQKFEFHQGSYDQKPILS